MIFMNLFFYYLFTPVHALPMVLPTRVTATVGQPLRGMNVLIKAVSLRVKTALMICLGKSPQRQGMPSRMIL